MKEHAVPQNIMSVDFKLFGSWLTLREFIFIGVSLAAAYLFYLLMKAQVLPPLLAWPIILTFGLGGPIVALVPFQERRLDQWLVSFLLAIRNPTKRVWKKKGYEPIVSKSDKLISRKDLAVASPLANLTKKKNVQNQDQTKEQPSNQIDQKEEARLNQISETMQTLNKNGVNSSQNQFQKKQTNMSSNMNQSPNNTQDQTATPNNSIQNQTTNKPGENPINNQINQQNIQNSTQNVQNTNQGTNQVNSQNSIPQRNQNEPQIINQTQTIQPTARNGNIESQHKPSMNILQNNQISQRSNIPNLNPSQNVNPKNSNSTVNTNQMNNQANPNQTNNQSPLNNSDQNTTAQTQLNQNSNVPISQKLEFQDTVNPAKNNSSHKQTLKLTEEVINKIRTEIPGLTNRPNIVNIVVKDNEGKVLSGVVCITKTLGTANNGKAVRAGISNPLGQIVNNIPLKNGSYKIILTKKGYNLPELEVNLNGQTLPAVEIRAL